MIYHDRNFVRYFQRWPVALRRRSFLVHQLIRSCALTKRYLTRVSENMLS